MAGKKATAADAKLILKLYDFRREPVMREARKDMISKFIPKSFDEFAAVTKGDHPLNTAYRMVSSYWEMAAGLVKHGALHLELFAENCGEGLILFAKAQPHLERLRKEIAVTAYLNMEWVVSHSKEAARRLEIQKKRIAALTAK
ncbi:MAG: hypothetical protein HY293_05375 [Planctomycetes bacterium]|nr:hypothetical protein [Planctomycetota bacterium]